jgi:hypothetical protein
MAPPIACGYMNILYMNAHERIALASRSTLNIDIRHLQDHVFTVKQGRSSKGHHYEDSTKVISIQFHGLWIWIRSSYSYQDPGRAKSMPIMIRIRNT